MTITLDADAACYLRWIRESLHTPPPIACVPWNEQHGRLSARDSALPGAWKIKNAPQMAHWLDLISARRLGRGFMGERDQYAHLTERIWLIAGTQSMKTRSLLYAAMGFCVDRFPCPKAYVLPRLKDFKRVLDNRLRPFFDETPQLERHFPRGKRDRTNAITYQAWRLITQTIYMLCGEIADDLRSFPVCDIFLDEFDLLPLNVKGKGDKDDKGDNSQGDPIEIVADRQKTWPRQRLMVGVTSPTGVNGHGWRRLCSGSHERLLVRCQRCSADQELHPDQLRWPAGATADQVKLGRLARWACAHCGHEIADDGTKETMVTEASAAHHWVPGAWALDAKNVKGLWTPSADFDDGHRLLRIHPPETTTRSGHQNSLYSRFVSLSDFVAHGIQVETKGDQAERIAHINGWRCEPYFPQLIAPPELDLIARVSSGYHYFIGAAPAGPEHVALICDQQGTTRASSWFPYEVKGYGADGEQWLIEAGDVDGFEELERLEAKTFNVGGRMMPIEVTALDGSNGTMRVPLQEWAARKPRTRFLLTGRFWPDYLWQLRVAGGIKERRNKRIITGARIFNFHANAYRTELDGRRRGIEGARKWNLPDDVPDFYLASMTAEEQKPAKVRMPGFMSKQTVLIWEPRVVYNERGDITVRTDNHWWDTSVMALVVSDIQGWSGTTPARKARVVSMASWFGRRP